MEQNPEISLAGAFLFLLILWWLMGRIINKKSIASLKKAQRSEPGKGVGEPSVDKPSIEPTVSLPGGIHEQWFDDLQQRLDGVNAGGSPFASDLKSWREKLSGGSAKQAVESLDASSIKNATIGRQMRDDAEQYLLGAGMARIAAGDLEVSLENFEGAVEQFSLAVEVIPLGHDTLFAEALNKFGTAQYRLGDYDKAMMAFRRALKLLGRLNGPNDPAVASVLNNLAMIHYERGEVDQARPLYERALRIDEAESAKTGGPSLSVATDLNNLGLLLKNQNLPEEAEPLLKRALSIKEELFETGDPTLITGLRNYASVLRALEREEEAAALDVRLG